MTKMAIDGSGGWDFAEPPVWVRIGAMDHRAVQQARQVLRQVSGRAGTNLVVDLACMDDQHELTMFALLSEAARKVAAHGGSVTALNPTGGLATSLLACEVRVIRFGPTSPIPPGTLTIDIGDALPAPRGS